MARGINKYPIPTTCLYCKSEVIYTSNKAVYGRTFGNGKCYMCTSCDAYVGVHNGTKIPLGRLANKELRELKKQAHALFDPIWKTKQKSRGKSYADLAKALGIPKKECHFGWFDKQMLVMAIQILKEKELSRKLLIHIAKYLKKDRTLIDEEGFEIVKNAMRIIRNQELLSLNQMAEIKMYHEQIKTNALKKQIFIA